MMQTYAEYKDSGVDWLGEIPAGWEVKPVFAVTSLKSVTNCADRELLSVYLDRGVIRFSDITEKRTNVTSLDLSNYQAVDHGDFVLNNQQAWRGSVGVSQYSGIVSPAYIVLKLSGAFHTGFANYLFRDGDMVAHYLVCSKGVGTIQRNLYWPKLKRTPLFLPPLPEQTAIAGFLDDKTAKIDELVGIKRRQIALLGERKQILIQNAVTKGLNPTAPMKDSGVDWIGNIPAHWEVKRNATLFQERKDAGSERLPVLSVSIHSGVSTKELSDEENIRSAIKIQDRTAYKEVLAGYIAYNMMRAWQGGIGAVKVHGMVSPAYVVAKPTKDLDAEYFELLYRTPAFIWQMDAQSKGITDFRKRLYWDGFRELVTLIPPLGEQQKIVKNCALASNKINAAITIKQNQITKLNEYKTTLINAAVTGKIKLV